MIHGSCLCGGVRFEINGTVPQYKQAAPPYSKA